MRVSGGVAIVTGAGRGIGAATARRLHADGWRLVLVDRCEDDPGLPYALATKGELDAVASATDAVACVADVRDQHALDGAVQTAVDTYGGLDAAVAVAGGIAGGEAWTMDETAWTAVLGVNLEGVWRLARAAVPRMLERGDGSGPGRFVAVASAGGTLGLPLLSAYSAAKHGVIGFIRSLAAELGPRGTTVNAVAPGSTRTAMLDASAAVYGLTDVDEFATHHLLQRLVTPDEVAEVIAWVCSPASSGITGAVLPVDAGMTAA
jgi:SDR family mycofactocin-dependent oxidoreductase